MDSSRRAVESYWRSRMIDGATSDEDKVTPVYKLEEVCDLLRSSHVSIVKEVSEFILKRLEHKSPVVKQKALRLIKYSVGKSGADFRREMQRHSVAVRQLLHYKGQPDPLKGDALNKGVRETAQDAISAIFSEENSKPAPAQISKRMEGFGNSNYEMRSSSSSSSDDRKSFLSEVVDIGSATIKQGLSNLAQGNHQRNNDPGSYRSPNLHRSLTVDPDNSSGRYEPVHLRNENHGSFGASRSGGGGSGGGSWGQDSRSASAMIENGNSSSSSYTESKTREERLLETIVTSGGVRLQPTRDAIHVFLVEAAKLDALALSRALESKLQSPSWQVRMKAVCVLESILRKRDDEKFSIIASYFDENIDVVEKCSQSPQSSLSEKARKVLSLLGGGRGGRMPSISETSIPAVSPAQIPDLIDTGESDFFKADDPSENSDHQVKPNVPVSTTTPFIHDLLGDSLGSTSENSTEQKNEDDDPFADVSFHTEVSKEQAGGDLFSGMNFDNNPTPYENQIPAANGPEIFDIFGSSNGLVTKNEEHVKADVNDLLAGMSISEGVKQQGNSSPSIPSEGISSGNMLGGPNLTMMNGSTVFPSAAMPYAMPPGMMLNPAFAAHSIPINYGAMGGFLAQQQLLATMSNFQQLSNNLNAAQNAGGGAIQGDGGATLPDIFHPSFPNQIPTSTMSSSKKEDTKAFDFISDHLAAARDPRRVS